MGQHTHTHTHTHTLWNVRGWHSNCVAVECVKGLVLYSHCVEDVEILSVKLLLHMLLNPLGKKKPSPNRLNINLFLLLWALLSYLSLPSYLKQLPLLTARAPRTYDHLHFFFSLLLVWSTFTQASRCCCRCC